MELVIAETAERQTKMVRTCLFAYVFTRQLSLTQHRPGLTVNMLTSGDICATQYIDDFDITLELLLQILLIM